MAVVTWKIETLVFWFVFFCDCEFMSTKLHLDIFCLNPRRWQFNYELAIVLFCFFFNASVACKYKNVAFVQSFDYTRLHRCRIFLNSLFSNPSSLSDLCWPCKMIFWPSKSSEMSSGLYCSSGREAILIGLCTANLFCLRWKLVSRACSPQKRAISLPKSHKTPKPETASL